jgi:hypothetical protein
MNKTKRIVPMFATEAEEAEWWYKNRNVHGKELLAAVKSGEAQILTRSDSGIQEEAGAGGGAADSRGGSGVGSKAGRGKGFTLPDLHQITIA